MTPSKHSVSDRFLVRESVAGDLVAWGMLHKRYEDRLLIIVRTLVRPGTADRETVVKEVAAEVWCCLFRRDLRGWQPGSGGFATYLTVVARQQLRLYRRRQRQPGRRLVSLPRQEVIDGDAVLLSIGAELDDFISTLSPRERECVEYRLHGTGPAAHFSAANLKKLGQKVRDKLRIYVHGQ